MVKFVSVPALLNILLGSSAADIPKIKVETSIPKNIRHFWSFNKNRKNKAGILFYMFYGVRTSSNPLEICDLFRIFRIFAPEYLKHHLKPANQCTGNNVRFASAL